MTKGAFEKTTLSRAAITVSSVLLTCMSCQATAAEDAENLFNQKCAGCHTVGGGNSVGPDLAPSTKWKTSELAKSIKGMEKNVGPLSQAEVDNFVEYLRGKGSASKASSPSSSGTSQTTATPSQGTNTGGGEAGSVAVDTTSGAPGAAPDSAPNPPAEVMTSAGNAPDAVTTQALSEPSSAQRGERLFSGSESLKNGGLSCIACHSTDGIGGTMAVELTEIYKKMSPQALVTACEKTPFKVMKTAYRDHPIEHQEALDLAAFLTAQKDRHEKPTQLPVTLIAFVFAGIVFAMIALGYRGRKGSAREKLQRKQ